MSEICLWSNAEFVFVFFLVTPYPKLELLYFGEPADLEILKTYTKSNLYTAVLLSFCFFLILRN